jgi:hypothetical protein
MLIFEARKGTAEQNKNSMIVDDDNNYYSSLKWQ